MIAKTIGKEQAQQVYRALYHASPQKKRRLPARCAQETPRHQAVLQHIPSPDSEAIRESSHLESQIDSDLQQTFNAYAHERVRSLTDAVEKVES